VKKKRFPSSLITSVLQQAEGKGVTAVARELDWSHPRWASG
jgi:hypothetical protein